MTKIKSSEYLIQFLESKARNHDYFHHYTNMKTLGLILKNKTIKLTRGNSEKLNDWHEARAKGAPNVWKKTYIACFSCEGSNNNKNKTSNIDYIDYNSENMAMWGLYGLPSDEAVRISLGGEDMKLFIKICKDNQDKKEKFIYTDGIIDEKNAISTDNIDFIELTDVFYLKSSNQDINTPIQKHINTVLDFGNNNLFDLFQKSDFTGFVKNYAWNYEKESRIILRLKKPIENENLFLRIPENIIPSFKIVLGPNFHKCEFNESLDNQNDCILNNLIRKFRQFGINDCRRSIFDGLVHFKSENY